MRLNKFFSFIILSALLWGCAPTAGVQMLTFPANGKVNVVEDGRTVKYGGILHLKAGKYTLVASKKGYYKGRLSFVYDGRSSARVVVPLGGRKPVLSDLTVQTSPPGGTVRVVETGRDIMAGGHIRLAAGRYTLRAVLKGYRDHSISVDLDGEHPQTITVPLGRGYAGVSVSAAPAGAVVSFDRGRPLPLPAAVELAAGRHELEVTKPGYFSATKIFTATAGKPLALKFSLRKIPDSGDVTVITSPAGGEIFFHRKKIGAGRADLGRLKFGSYEVSGIKMLNKLTRLTGRRSFSLAGPKGILVTLKLQQRQRLFAGKWLAAKEAAAREEARYLRQRVANPVHIRLNLTGAALLTLRRDKMLAAHLLTILRVGDRAAFVSGGRLYRLAKRRRALTPEFELEVAALRGRGKSLSAWPPEKGAKDVSVKAGDNPLAALAFALHRARSPYPLLDLESGQLARGGETVYRSGADGELTIIALGGAGLTVKGGRRAGFANLSIWRIAAGKKPLRVQWRRVPKRLLVMSDTAVPLAAPPAGVVLKIREKRLLRLINNVKVTELVRLSHGPDYQGWRRQRFTAAGPFAGQIDLGRDEIGPQEKSGHYQRFWLIRFKDAGGISQRQQQAAYEVSEVVKNSGSGIFLRRDKKDSKR